MQPVGTCPRCGIGSLSLASVEETIAVGNNVVQVTVAADVCSYCSERWFGPQATAAIDAAIQRLRDGDTSQLIHVGEVFRVS